MSDPPVYFLDELELRPGMLEPFLASLEADYEPAASERGMRRVHTWVTPPVELAAGRTHLLVIWEVAGAAGFWGSRAGDDPGVLAWWKACEERYLVSRSRRYAASAEDLSALDAASKQFA